MKKFFDSVRKAIAFTLIAIVMIIAAFVAIPLFVVLMIAAAIDAPKEVSDAEVTARIKKLTAQIERVMKK